MAGGLSMAENVSKVFQLLKRGNIEYVKALSWMCFMLTTLYFPSAAKEKVYDVNRMELANLSSDEAENFVAREVTTLAQYQALIRHPIEFLVGPVIGRRAICIRCRLNMISVCTTYASEFN